MNDNLGHETGDAVLKETAKRLKACTPKEDLLFRIGGDEFIVLLECMGDTSHIKAAAKDIIQIFQKPFIIGNETILIELSMGIAVSPDDGDNAEKLLSLSDKAMYQAKQKKGSCFKFYHTGKKS